MVLSLDFQPLSRSFTLLPPTLLPGVLNKCALYSRPGLVDSSSQVVHSKLATSPITIIDHGCQCTTAHTHSVPRVFTLSSSFPMVGLSSADVADVMTRHIPGTSPLFCSLSRILPRSTRTLPTYRSTPDLLHSILYHNGYQRSLSSACNFMELLRQQKPDIPPSHLN